MSLTSSSCSLPAHATPPSPSPFPMSFLGMVSFLKPAVEGCGCPVGRMYRCPSPLPIVPSDRLRASIVWWEWPPVTSLTSREMNFPTLSPFLDFKLPHSLVRILFFESDGCCTKGLRNGELSVALHPEGRVHCRSSIPGVPGFQGGGFPGGWGTTKTKRGNVPWLMMMKILP